jgi:hypothetical protein
MATYDDDMSARIVPQRTPAGINGTQRAPCPLVPRTPGLRVCNEHLLLLPQGELLHLLPVLPFELVDSRLEALRGAAANDQPTAFANKRSVRCNT